MIVLFTQSKTVGQSSNFEYEIDQREVYVSMQDGTELWGCLTYPEAVENGEKFPALLVFDPYAGDCSLTYYYEGPQAEKGYVVGYFHVRGSGRSEGTFMDREYSEQELDDAIQLIDWLANQSWSTGNVGMYGWSWSGFNALQVAMKKPNALKAIIANVATEDLYHEDVHYADGIFRFGTYNMFADLNLIYTPPPLNPTDEILLNKRFNQPPLSLRYLREQKDGGFWRKSIRLDQNPDLLTVPTYLIGGYYDGYRSAVPRTLAHAEGPVKAVLGPWVHNLEEPEPTADLTKLMVRWWDHWLKEKDTGVMNDPDLMTYLRAPYLPSARVDTIPGRWQAIKNWPPENLYEESFYLTADQSMNSDVANSDSLQLRYLPTDGAEANIWWGDVISDQRDAESHSLFFETSPFEEEKAILGQPESNLWVSASATHANWIVRLSDVAPDGTITRITGAAKNGTHRDSSMNPELLEPGKIYELQFPLHFTSWIIKPGHKLRVSISNATWPMFWPTPYKMITSLFVGAEYASSIQIPFIEIAPDSESEKVATLIGSKNISKDGDRQLSDHSGMSGSWAGPSKIIRDEAKAETTVIYSEADSTSNPRTYLEVVYKVNDYDPSNASVMGKSEIDLENGGNRYRWKGTTTIKSDSTNFYYRHVRTLLMNDEEIRRNVWDEIIRREYQ